MSSLHGPWMATEIRRCRRILHGSGHTNPDEEVPQQCLSHKKLGYVTPVPNQFSVKLDGLPSFRVIEGSLEVKLPTIWTVEKQR